MTNSGSMSVEAFFDPKTCTISYIIRDARTNECAIVDSVLDFDIKSGRISTGHADVLIARVQQLRAKSTWLLETHVHADHLSAAQYLKGKIGGKIAIGAGVKTVQRAFGSLFNLDSDFFLDGRQFDVLLEDNATLQIGGLSVLTLHTPGHTPACVTYVVTDGIESAAFVGDTLFAPDCGTARCDFPGGDARTLFQSIERVLDLPAATKIYICHDYQPGGRDVDFASTVASQKTCNIHVHKGISEHEFVAMRSARDKSLDMPALYFPSVQVNICAGNFPRAEANCMSYLKIPLNGIP